MKIERKISEFKSLTKVVKRVEFKDMFLTSSQVHRSLNALEYEFDKVRVDISFKGTLLEDQKKHFLAKVNFSMKATPEETDEDNEIVSIESEYMLFYVVKDRKGLTKKDIKAFCSMNALFNAWPYWREYVHSMTNRMELPTFTMPLLKFRAPSTKEGKEVKTKKQSAKIKA
jgi:preprotein translocase subunit SecB